MTCDGVRAGGSLVAALCDWPRTWSRLRFCSMILSRRVVAGRSLSTSCAGAKRFIYQLLSNVAAFKRREVPSVVTHSNVQPVFDLYANVQDRDLGGVAADVERVITEFRPKLPPGSRIVVEGQA